MVSPTVVVILSRFISVGNFPLPFKENSHFPIFLLSNTILVLSVASKFDGIYLIGTSITL